jgi:hypothetical protein
MNPGDLVDTPVGDVAGNLLDYLSVSIRPNGWAVALQAEPVVTTGDRRAIER